MLILRSLPLIVAALALTSTAALAAPPTAANADSINAGLQAMREYNVIALKDLKVSSDIGGRAFVGGDLTGTATLFSNPKGQTGVAAAVAGDVSGSSAKNVNNGGSLKVGGDLSSGANMNGGGNVYVEGDARKVNANGGSVYADGDVSKTNAGHIYYGGQIDKNSHGAKHAGDHTAAGLQAELQTQAAAYDTQLDDLSGYLSGLDATAFMTTSGQKAVFDAGVGSGLAVFAIADIETALRTLSEIQFAFPTSYDTVIVNVGGEKITLPGSINFNGPSGLGSKVIWNFYEAESINFNAKGWYGSVLAPQADLKGFNFIDGTVVANDIQGGAIRNSRYAGALSLAAPSPLQNIADAVAVPEPTTWALMILGFGAVGAMLRRRRGALEAT